jgi:hypothetical protein
VTGIGIAQVRVQRPATVGDDPPAPRVRRGAEQARPDAGACRDGLTGAQFLAFLAQAAVVPELAAAADDAAKRLQEPLAERIAHAIQAGELPARLDPSREATRLQLLIYGLMVDLATTNAPRPDPSQWAQAIVDEHIAALAAGS